MDSLRLISSVSDLQHKIKTKFRSEWNIHHIIDFVTNAVYDYYDKSHLADEIPKFGKHKTWTLRKLYYGL
jgi:hypothetical protein